ncbi:sensor histidine kinase [Caenimonas aquaedulcis]|uniref:histidine kinase n=1 Tax=Caenimonas aquaedulcis TaxID=2793270 RepID=A0A931H6S5_9BURK|nr:ATP-binding protein [Caenimonas aquaedulcis]MBG9389636.1 two-component sensor histidine kinase [Caenimonas aquaedulcis]
MRNRPARHGPWIPAWLALSVLGGVILSRLELAHLRDDFETDARIVHRLLSQRAVQHDAILETLALLQPAGGSDRAEQRLPSVYPQILSVERRDADAAWPDAALRSAEAVSRAQKRPALADADFPKGRYRIVLGAQPASFALTLDLASAVPGSEWPMARDSSPVRVVLEHAGMQYVVQPGRVQAGGWAFDFRKHLAADSQPFDVVATRSVGWGELPWPWILAWTLAAGALVAGIRSLRRQRAGRERAEELLRLGQVARLNTLGELAAGMAHELNQPLTAMMASTQAARRLLDDDPTDLVTARDAMAQAVQQGRRASDVVSRLRRVVERPGAAAQLQPVDLQEAARNAFYLLEPEFARRQVRARLADAAPVRVNAEPVALEQIVHNLLMNALQALDQVPEAQRELLVSVASQERSGVLVVADTGPGIAPEVMPRIFEPFFSTREAGLGLGLSLCETLAAGMGGRLEAAQHAPRGAEFRLTLPGAAP